MTNISAMGQMSKKTLTFNEALYAFLDMTGFTRIAEMDGNKMETYINVANKNNFLDGINVSEAQKKLTAKTFFDLAHNVLFKVPLVRTNDGGKTYYLDKSRYFMNELLGYKKVTGVVKANSYTSLNTLDSAGEGKIKIDEECYDADMVADFDDYLGFSVIAYINRDKDVFPHYWSALTSIAYLENYMLTGDEKYYKKGLSSLKACLCLFNEKGEASCAYLYPYMVNGCRGEYYDPWANDQDFALYYNCKYIRSMSNMIENDAEKAD